MDIAIFLDECLQPDISFENGSIVMDDGLETAVFISLFTDKRDNGQRGWFGDIFEDEPLGSKLWTLDREKSSPKVLSLAKTYCEEALKWLITEGVAKQISIEVIRVFPNTILIHCDIYKPPDLKDPIKYKYQLNWDAQNVKRI